MTKRLLPPIIALVALTLYGAFLMRHASYAVGGSDSSGYANIARSLTTGRLVERVEMLDRFALPDGFASAFAPLAYLLGPRPGTLTPFYPVGLPLHLAVAAIIGGWRSGPFFVVPILATLSLLFIYLAGRELDLSRALAGTSALMLGICPVFLFQAQWVMSDVAATFWALVAVFASLRARRRAAWALLAGFAFGIGVLVRPTSALMLIPVLFGLPLRPRCLLFFALGGLPTAMILFVYDLTAYGSIWRTGYGQIGLTDVPPDYDSDSVWSYEIGTKNSFADNRVLLNASAYFVQWKDIQQNVPLTACGFQFTGNLGEAESKGFDVQAQARVTDGLTLGGTFAYTDAQFTQTVQLQPTVQSIVSDGDHLAGSPWTVVVFGQYDFPLFDRPAYVRADYQYSAQQDDATFGQNPANGGFALWFPSVPVQSYTSLRAGMKWDRFDVSVFAQNLFDTQPKLTQTQDIGTPEGGTPLFYAITWRPRTVGLTATYNF